MYMTHNAHRAGLAEPDRFTSETADVASAGRIEEQGGTDGANSAASAAVGEADKAFTTLRAMLALRGFALDIVSDGHGGTAYMVHKWSMSRALPDMPAVRAFVEQVGACNA